MTSSTLPANLGRLPVVALRLIEQLFWLEHDWEFLGRRPGTSLPSIGLPVPQLYLRLALVNKNFYEFFMSNAVWKKLDVHGAKRNISRHYLDNKQQMTAAEFEFSGQFDFNCWRFPLVSLAEYNGFSLYTRAFVLSTLWLGNEDQQLDVLQCTQSDFNLLKFCSRSPMGVFCAKPELLLDRSFVMEMAADGSFVYVHDIFRNDKELALRVIQNHPPDFLSADLRDDRDVILAATKRWGEAGWAAASERLRGDLDVAKAAVSHEILCLGTCSPELKNNFELVMHAVKCDGIALLFASQELKANFDVAAAAVKSNPHAIKFVAEELQQRLCSI